MDVKLDIPKRKRPSKHVCKYGESCYRKNAEHLREFEHPKNSGKKKKTPASENESQNVKEAAVVPLSVNLSLNSSVLKYEENVCDVLKTMPKDFFDFWHFCAYLNKSKPEEALAEMGLHLVGVYDIMSKKLPFSNSASFHCHWRYYYDPPEFQTVIKIDGEDLNHIGYFRDDPDEFPSMLASNSASLGPKFTVKGDNIFAAVNAELKAVAKGSRKKGLAVKVSKILAELQDSAKEGKYSLEIQTAKIKTRRKKVVARSFHTLGIVVPVVNDIGYRPLPESDASLKSILHKIVNAGNETKRLEEEESLDEIMTNVQFANDECDYGMGLELGIDLFCFGHPYLHPHILSILPLAYDLLKRRKYGEIVKAHLANRRKGDDLNDLK